MWSIPEFLYSESVSQFNLKILLSLSLFFLFPLLIIIIFLLKDPRCSEKAMPKESFINWNDP